MSSYLLTVTFVSDKNLVGDHTIRGHVRVAGQLSNVSDAVEVVGAAGTTRSDGTGLRVSADSPT